MNQEKLAVTSCDPTSETRRGRRGLHWPDVFLSALLMLAVAVPTMAVEEDWHGRPMIDQGTPLAAVAGCLVAAAFLAGSRRLWFAHEGVPGAVAWLWCLGVVAVLLLAAAGSLVGRRLALGAGPSRGQDTRG